MVSWPVEKSGLPIKYAEVTKSETLKATPEIRELKYAIFLTACSIVYFMFKIGVFL